MSVPASSNSKPLWLLDIDGVVNAVARGPVRDSFPADQWEQCVIRAVMPGNGFIVLPIYAARPVLDFITAVFESGRAEIRWHSTWRTAAVTEFAPALGLPRAIPISIAPEWTARPEGWWKQPAAERALASGRRLVWTDDDIDFYRSELGAFDGHDSALLISPAPASGLTQDELDRIDAFLR